MSCKSLLFIITMIILIGCPTLNCLAAERPPASKVGIPDNEKKTSSEKTNNGLLTDSGDSHPAMEHKVIVYYFHGTMRCRTCLNIEAYTGEVLEAFYKDEINDKRLEWRVLNVDQTEHEHYWEDYGLSSSSLIIADMSNGRQMSWKNLEKIWDLAHDEEALKTYVKNEVAAYLARD